MDSASKPIIIKRYANRKLYNTNDSCYIKLDEIYQMVKSGIDVKIIDHRTKRDITSVTLAQTIFEKEKKQKALPSQTLRAVIQSGSDAISDFLQKRVKISQFKGEAEKTAQLIENLLSKGGLGKDEGSGLIREILNSTQTNLEELQRKIDDRIKTTIGPVANLHLMRKELDSLSSQVDLLAEKIINLENMISNGKNTPVEAPGDTEQ